MRKTMMMIMEDQGRRSLGRRSDLLDQNHEGWGSSTHVYQASPCSDCEVHSSVRGPPESLLLSIIRQHHSHLEDSLKHRFPGRTPGFLMLQASPGAPELGCNKFPGGADGAGPWGLPQ